MTEMLRIRNLSFSYRNKKVLDNVTFSAQKGELIAILGPNGAGKSTLLKCIAGILKCQGVEIFSKPLEQYTRRDLARIVGYVPQRFDPGMLNVYNLILLGRKPYVSVSPSKEDIEIVNRVVERLNLQHLVFQRAKNLSGGELQKVSIARALVQEPEILLLDEPTNNLDPKNQIEIMEIVQDFVKSGKMALVVMHEINLALRFADRFIFMKDGKNVSDGERSILTPDLFWEVYGVNGVVKEILDTPVFVLRGKESPGSRENAG
ncbi:iron(III) ABC transporter ATP-binding protein [Thermotoga sp. TBGT1765]|nr:iron(III) ABC transporter ATP-binding protein [Thermotoga sp. Cell2]KHC91146.1 iron(III) ABC transporter ATP-binding protein [Thermotoga sp. TBGT1765]KHC96646.1 iron(III) ABC transporter ATP-binding protein [Thermotoga sp. Xyl54]